MHPIPAAEWGGGLQDEATARDPALAADKGLPATEPYAFPKDSALVTVTGERGGAEASRGVTNPHELISVRDAIRRRVEDTLLEWNAFSGMQPDAEDLDSGASASGSSLEVIDARQVLASQRTRIKSLLARHETSAASRQQHLESLVEDRARRTAERSRHALNRSDAHQDVTRRTDAGGWGHGEEPEMEDFGSSYDAFLDDLLTFDEVETAMKAAQDGDDSLLQAVGGASTAQVVRVPVPRRRAVRCTGARALNRSPCAPAPSTQTRVGLRTARRFRSSPPPSSCRSSKTFSLRAWSGAVPRGRRESPPPPLPPSSQVRSKEAAERLFLIFSSAMHALDELKNELRDWRTRRAQLVKERMQRDAKLRAMRSALRLTKKRERLCVLHLGWLPSPPPITPPPPRATLAPVSPRKSKSSALSW